MVINALNSGANVYMADAEDSESPTWKNIINGQINLYDAVRDTITYFDEEKGARYCLNDNPAVLMFRPRGWHLLEKHVLVNGEPISASFFDFGLYFYHNVKDLLDNGTGPYFYLPKLESHEEAKLWDDVFTFAEEHLDVPYGSTKATVLIETLPAAFEMDEILYALRNHVVGLNCGRWDYIFSFIKKLSEYPNFVLPNRGELTMDKEFLRFYAFLLVRTCHRRGAHAMGGMAAQIPIKNDPKANNEAMLKVGADKAREVEFGHDGTWVAHPALVKLAREIFDLGIPGPNQLGVGREDEWLEHLLWSPDRYLLAVPNGDITEMGLRTNVSVGVRYLEAWLRGVGCLPINNLMEDAATAEICRAQVWQWLTHGIFRKELVSELVEKEVESIGSPEAKLAGKIFSDLVSSPNFVDFLTIPAYDVLLDLEKGAVHGA
jgi:malate synthase